MVMAVYNTDFHLVKRAIDSVLTQNFPDFELIIVDDGSKIDLENQLVNYSKKFENKISYLRHKNRGQSASINRAILNSSGKYISILDADDEYKSNHVRACLEEMKSADLIASTTETIVDKDEDYYVPDKFDPFEVVHVDNCILFATLFGKKEVFTTINFADMYGADAHFFENAAKKYRVRKVNLKTYIYYRNIPNSLCSTLKRKNRSAFA